MMQMGIWHTEISLATLNERGKQTLVDYLDIKMIEIGEDFLIASMPVNEKTKQPVGILHGGATCALVESVGSIAGNFCVDNSQQYCVGLDINVNHLRPMREGLVFGKAKPFHLGRTTQVWGVDITNERNKLVAVGRLTLAILNR